MKLILPGKRLCKYTFCFGLIYFIFIYRFAHISNNTMSQTISTLKQNIQNCASESINGNRIAGETNNQILALKAKHEEEKESFEVEIKKL